MTSGALTSPPVTAARLVVDTDVASFIFKWHPEWAPRYTSILKGSELVVSFMTLAELRQGAHEANWGQRKRELLETYLGQYKVLHSDSDLCSTWAEIRKESRAQGHPISVADARIAATALLLSAPLVTNNVKDYRHLRSLSCITASE